jgi:LacI family transcriptional regulator
MDRDDSPSNGSHATLIDVAARARVSVATASRALSSGKVSKKNLEKVSKAAAQLGYVPNETARNLRSVRTMTMGVVYHQLGGGASLELLDALTATVEDQGYSLFISTARGQDERFDALVNRFLERRVDALFCVHPAGDGKALKRFERVGTPVLALFSQSGGYSRIPIVNGVLDDASKAAIRHLSELGHKKIGVVLTERRMSALTAFTATAAKMKMPMHQFRPAEGVFDANIYLAGLMEERDRPTVVVALYTDAVAILQACMEMNIDVPGDLSVVSIGDHGAYTAVGVRTLSAIRTNPGKLGRAAGALMLEWLGGKSPTGHSTIDIATWLDRATTGPAPKVKS